MANRDVRAGNNQNAQLSETSQNIARYLMDQGDKPSWATIPGHYVSQMELPDGRKLSVYFCNVNDRDVEDPMRNSRLEVTLKPVSDNQVGYQTMEHGLSGQFASFRILTGTADNMIDGWFSFGRDTLSDFTRNHLQEKYDRLMQEVYTALSGN